MGDGSLMPPILGAFLLLGGFYDILKRRIPNWLNLIGLLAALIVGFLQHGGAGLVNAGLGMLSGLLALLPLYAFASMGAGDVKMMAVVGAFTGTAKVLTIALLSVLTAGVLSIIIILLRGELPALCQRYGAMLTHLIVTQEKTYVPPQPGEWASRRVAFAPAIAIGAAMALFWSPDWLPTWV